MLTSDQKTALDTMFGTWSTYDRAKADLEFVQPKTGLATATTDTIAAVVADIRADFSLLWS